MNASVLASPDLLAILPEILVVILVGVILLVDVLSKHSAKNFLGWMASGGLLLILIIKIVFLYPGDRQGYAWGEMIVVDAAAFFFQVLILIGAIITIVLTIDQKKFKISAEYYALLLISSIGMSFMAAASNLIMLYLAIETTSIPLYALAGFNKQDNKSVESGLKYLLFGAMTSAFMLYGFSFLYGFSGSTNLSVISKTLAGGSVPMGIGILILFLVVVGFGFKTSIVPFHFWAPDVYHGAPSPISGFLSTASKAAGFIVLMRFMLTVYPASLHNWVVIASVLAAVTMTVGNLLALVQKDLKRLLAYSSISHAGYILIGVAASTQLGIKSAMYYLLVYLFTNLAAFGIAAILEDATGSTEISKLTGLVKRSPWIAFAFLATILSLTGIPPFGGFISKFLVLAAGIQANLVWLVIVAIVNSFIGLYYYLGLLKLAFSNEGDLLEIHPKFSWKLAIGTCILAIVILGIFYTPWFQHLDLASVNLLTFN